MVKSVDRPITLPPSWYRCAVVLIDSLAAVLCGMGCHGMWCQLTAVWDVTGCDYGMGCHATFSPRYIPESDCEGEYGTISWALTSNTSMMFLTCKGRNLTYLTTRKLFLSCQKQQVSGEMSLSCLPASLAWKSSPGCEHSRIRYMAAFSFAGAPVPYPLHFVFFLFFVYGIFIAFLWQFNTKFHLNFNSGPNRT